MRRYPWSAEEDKILRRLNPDYAAVKIALPSRSIIAIRWRARYLKLQSRYRVLTSEESLLIASLWPNVQSIKNQIPDLSSRAIRMHAQVTLRLPRIREAGKRFSTEEIEAVRKGALYLPDRTSASLSSMRCRLGAQIKPRWTTAEITALKVNPYAHVSGRSEGAQKALRSKLGLVFRSEVNNSCSPGSTILQSIQSCIPYGLPRQIREEVLSDLTLAVLEGKVELVSVSSAVRSAIKGVYKRYPVLGAKFSLDIPLFHRGGGTFGDRITNDTFHF